MVDVIANLGAHNAALLHAGEVALEALQACCDAGTDVGLREPALCVKCEGCIIGEAKRLLEAAIGQCRGGAGNGHG